MEEDVKVDNGIKDCTVFESQLMTLFRRCHSCGLGVKLETSIVGTLLVVNGIYPDGHVLHWQSQPMVRVWQLIICCYLQLFYSVASPLLVLLIWLIC